MAAPISLRDALSEYQHAEFSKLWARSPEKKAAAEAVCTAKWFFFEEALLKFVKEGRKLDYQALEEKLGDPASKTAA